jgi:hypothetical protein
MNILPDLFVLENSSSPTNQLQQTLVADNFQTDDCFWDDSCEND